MKHRTALLVFANSAKFESQNKPFKASETLFDALNAHTLKIVKKTGLPYFHFSEKNQVGDTFGERYVNAIQQVYNLGFKAIITIGNDTPHLSANHILKAANDLNQNKIVFGPSLDGGFYLMGLNKTHFKAEAFKKLPWQTSSLLTNFIKLLNSVKTNISYLEQLSDLDKSIDIKRLLDSFKKTATFLKKIILSIFKDLKIAFEFIFIFEITFFTKAHFNKGSPQLLHF